MDTKTRPIYMWSTRDPLQTKGHIQTESEGLEKDFPPKWKSKESWSSNTQSDKMDFKIKNLGFPGCAVVENLPASAGDMGSSPGLGRSHMPWSN